MASIECDECGTLIPARLTNRAEREGVAIVEALCPECSPTGNYHLKFEFPDPHTGGGDTDD